MDQSTKDALADAETFWGLALERNACSELAHARGYAEIAMAALDPDLAAVAATMAAHEVMLAVPELRRAG